MDKQLNRRYGLFTAVGMVAGIVIGSGVFFKAQTILTNTGGNMPLGILAWVLGGMIMLACLLTFSFMAQKYEKVNGLVDYAEATVGPRYGYHMGWFIGTIYYPAIHSALCWVSARYTLEFILSVNPDFPMLIPAAQGGTAISPECMVLTLFYLCGLYALNAFSPKLAGKFQTSTMVIKLIPIGLMAVVGIIYGLANGMLQNNFSTVATVESVSTTPLFTAVCSTAFAYDGWIIATSINSELKDSKKNLPKALILGSIIIISAYIVYYIGVAGGASNQELIEKGATLAFTNIFGGFLGNVLNLFIAISCLGTANGLTMGSSRCMYSLACRNEGPNPKMFRQVDDHTNIPPSSFVYALLMAVIWFTYFFFSNLAGTWKGAFVFDPTELPIVAIYTMYIPIFVQWMRKEKEENVLRRFIIPTIAIAGALFMALACVISHGWSCIWYVIVFTAITIIGEIIYRKNHKN